MTDVTEPEDFPKAFEHALNSGRLEQITALYNEAATLRGSSGEVVSGTAATQAEMEKLIAANAHITNTLRQTLRNGDTALILVDYVLGIDAPDGKRVELEGTATNVIRNFPGRGWRLIIANPQGVA